MVITITLIYPNFLIKNNSIKPEKNITEYELWSTNDTNNITVPIHNMELKYTIHVNTSYKGESSTAISNDEGEWLPIDGVWELNNGIYSQKSSGSFMGSIARKISISNFTMESKVRRCSSSYAGIIFRYRDNKYSYWWHLKGDDENAQLAITQVQPIETIPIKHSAKVWYKLKIKIIGNHIEGYIDDQSILDVKNDELTERDDNKIGLMTYDGCADFSDIIIKNITEDKVNIIINYSLSAFSLSNVSITPFLLKKHFSPSKTFSYSSLQSDAFKSSADHYHEFDDYLDTNNSIIINGISADDLRPPDIIYFPTESYQNRTFAIRLIARGWDEERQEWVFKEFTSHGFTWEDIINGRTITGGGNRTE